MRLAFSILSLLLMTNLSFGQCSNGRCIVPEYHPAVVVHQQYWRVWPDNPQQAFLQVGERTIGGYDLVSDEYRPYHNGVWGEPTQAPVAMPVSSKFFQARQAQLPTGVDPGVLDGPESYTRKGVRVTRQEALHAVIHTAAAGIPDDVKMRHLTIVCKDASGKAKAEEAIASLSMAQAVKPFRLQMYDASRKVDQIMLEPFRLDQDEQFKETGKLWLVQEAEENGKGKVLLTMYGEPGQDAVLEALRGVDPNYVPPKKAPPVDPNKDKDKDKKGGKDTPKKGDGAQRGEYVALPYLATGALAAIAAPVILLRRRRLHVS